MECRRCKGLMVPDVFEDLEHGPGALCFRGWRCLICGEIVDSVILSNRLSPPPPHVSRARVKKQVLVLQTEE